MDKLQDELTAADLAKWRELHTDSGFWYSKPILRLVDEVERQCEQLERARDEYQQEVEPSIRMRDRCGGGQTEEEELAEMMAAYDDAVKGEEDG